MRLALPIALLAFAGGLAAGLFVERSRHAAPESAAAEPGGTLAGAEMKPSADGLPAGKDLEAELKKAKERIRELKSELATLKGSLPEDEDPLDAKQKARDLRARIPELVEKGDGPGLVALMKELAALGEAGYKGAMEIAEIFRKAFKDGDEAFGVPKVAFNKAFGSALVPLMTWALANPGEASAWFRGHSIHMLYWVSDVDAGPIFIEALAKEGDPNLAAAMAGYIERLAKPEMVADIEEAARLHAGKPQAMRALVDALVSLHSPESGAALRKLAGDANPALRAAAEIALIEHSPPAAGVMITTTRPKSQAESVGLQKGDIIVSYDGKPVESLDKLRKSVQAKADKDLVTVMVNRGGTLVPVQITGDWIGIDGKFVKPQ